MADKRREKPDPFATVSFNSEWEIDASKMDNIILGGQGVIAFVKHRYNGLKGCAKVRIC